MPTIEKGQVTGEKGRGPSEKSRYAMEMLISGTAAFTYPYFRQISFPGPGPSHILALSQVATSPSIRESWPPPRRFRF